MINEDCFQMLLDFFEGVNKGKSGDSSTFVVEGHIPQTIIDFVDEYLCHDSRDCCEETGENDEGDPEYTL